MSLRKGRKKKKKEKERKKCINIITEIKYAKPKRGKTAQGVWKDIVNVNDYTQTLRMEKCL
jgi:hypothetical protein